MVSKELVEETKENIYLTNFSLIIANLCQNSVEAKAKKIDISIHEMIRNNKFFIEIADNGCGISKEKLSEKADTFYVVRPTGLGLSLFHELVTKAEGTLKVITNKCGTTIRALMQYDHKDLLDIGNIEDTIFDLVIKPNVDISFEYLVEDSRFTFNTHEIKKKLCDIEITEPSIQEWLKKSFLKELNVIRRKI